MLQVKPKVFHLARASCKGFSLQGESYKPSFAFLHSSSQSLRAVCTSRLLGKGLARQV